MAELSKQYDPKLIEQSIYESWEDSGYFNPDNLPGKRGKPFVISMPPPNITGELHLGHALGFTIQDILTRYHRMKGDRALWVPGTDHAAIATQVMVERMLRQQGIDRRSLDREKFLEHVWAWKEKYGERIVEQTKRLGASADWSREHFTMDEDLTVAVQTAFIQLYQDGLIYRGERIINWCPECATAISDLEVDHEEEVGKLWYIKYPLTDGSAHITVATTRPETMLGDTAVAVHPDDARYKAFVGKTVRLPLVNRHLPIIADTRVEKEFGTGAVKVTPAHDLLDFELGQTHHLESVQVIGFDGKTTATLGPDFSRLTVLMARAKVIDELRRQNLLEKEEDYTHAVAYCSRSKTAIEPLVSLQWFVKTQTLARKALQAVKSGETVIVPKRFEKIFFRWLENIRDWNISRQIWWGHRLPVWYKRYDRERREYTVAVKSPGSDWVQDEDTLDTWFSSGLWTFSTLGWPGRPAGGPKKTKDLKRFHPTTVMATAWDILFFWVARMMMFSLHFLNEVPFKTVYLHGLILDRDGKKMSKSKGTGIDPLVMIDKYGSDALRMSLIIGNAPGQGFRMFEEKISGYRNFANKLWNVSRFILSKPRPASPILKRGGARGGGRDHAPDAKQFSLADQWILSRMNSTIHDVTTGIDRFDFSTAGTGLYNFLWHDFADWHLEISKLQPNLGVLYHVLETVLKLLHPFMPFITEAIWAEFHEQGMLIVEPWPKDKIVKDRKAVGQFQRSIKAPVVGLRNLKIHGARNQPLAIALGKPSLPDTALISALASVNFVPMAKELTDVTIAGYQFWAPADVVTAFERWREKEKNSLQKYISSLESKLKNEQYKKNAPDQFFRDQQKLLESTAKLGELR